MRVSDTLLLPLPPRSLDRVERAHEIRGQPVAKTRDTLAPLDPQRQQEASETDVARYGELLPRPRRAAEKVVTAPVETPANMKMASAAHGLMTQVSPSNAIDIYKALQAHTTPQSSRSARLVDLYA